MGTGAFAVAEIEKGKLTNINLINSGSGYFTEPTVSIQSRIPYVVNTELNLIQFKTPHGIPNQS